MTRAHVAIALVVVAGLLAAGIILAAPRALGFPHLRHERLFPVCAGCHAGIATGRASEVHPPAASCARCHDGRRAPRVTYAPPARRASNLRFSHTRHAQVTEHARQPLECRACHEAPDGPRTRMNVAAPQPAQCMGCHQAPGRVHIVPVGACTKCHVPVAEAVALTPARVAAFPKPEWHDSATFITTHGRYASAPGASCSVCHARQTCERCHANADRIAAAAGLPPDPRVAALEAGRKPAYPKPASHDAAWRTTHGAVARRSTASCANCHTRPSCAGCHQTMTGAPAAAIAALPDTAPGGAPGVTLTSATGAIHPPGFVTRHGPHAATGTLQCSDCHSQQTCTACHAGTESRAFHPANFVERHAADVFAGSSSCQSCHSTETFCRDCHVRTGIASRPAMNGAFHTAQPMWILSHGQAARTGMESCASCHRQNDCVRCHSAVGGWRVNPHGPGFPASRLSARNAASCKWCHSATPGLP